MTDNQTTHQIFEALSNLRRSSVIVGSQMAAALVRVRQSGIEMGHHLAVAHAFEQGRRLGFEQGIAAANEYAKAAEDFDRDAANLETMDHD